MRVIFSAPLPPLGTLGKLSAYRIARWIIFVALLLTGCAQAGEAPPPPVSPKGTIALPTPAPPLQPTPVSTPVVPLEVVRAMPTPTPIHAEASGLVVDVLDGHTIVVILEGDSIKRAYKVCYVGVEGAEASSEDPWGRASFEVNKGLTKLRVVRLVRDRTDFDTTGCLLRHVYVDNQLVSVILAEQGLVKAAIEGSNNNQFRLDILEAEARARDRRAGLWGQIPPTPVATALKETSKETPTVVMSPTLTTTAETKSRGGVSSP